VLHCVKNLGNFPRNFLQAVKGYCTINYKWTKNIILWGKFMAVEKFGYLVPRLSPVLSKSFVCFRTAMQGRKSSSVVCQNCNSREGNHLWWCARTAKTGKETTWCGVPELQKQGLKTPYLAATCKQSGDNSGTKYPNFSTDINYLR